GGFASGLGAVIRDSGQHPGREVKVFALPACLTQTNRDVRFDVLLNEANGIYRVTGEALAELAGELQHFLTHGGHVNRDDLPVGLGAAELANIDVVELAFELERRRG